MTSDSDDAWAPLQGPPAAPPPPARASVPVQALVPAQGAGSKPPSPANEQPLGPSEAGVPEPTVTEPTAPQPAPVGPPSSAGALYAGPTVPAHAGSPPPGPTAEPAFAAPAQPSRSALGVEPPSNQPLEPRMRAGRRRSGVPAGVVVLLMLVSLLIGALAGLLGGRWVLPESTPSGLPTVEDRDARADPVGDTWISQIAAAVLPSTVYIEVRIGTEGVSGSGFVVREDGYIVTNHHVIADAEGGGGDVTVVFPDGKESTAEIVGSTADYDLAVLKIDRTGLVPLVLADSDALAVGDPVIAVGAPLGLTGSVTAGIVSAVERPVTVRSPDASGDDASSYINAIQTDASINRGNSGGPLIDADGHVVGVNTAVARDSSSGGGGNEPGFAIPSNQVRHTVEQLIETGQATYPVVGVLLDPEHEGEGVAVRSDPINGMPPVTPGGPADEAGIQPGDVIVAVDGEPVSQPTELIVRVRAHLPGETIVLTVRTNDGDRDIEVVLGEQVSQ